MSMRVRRNTKTHPGNPPAVPPTKSASTLRSGRHTGRGLSKVAQQRQADRTGVSHGVSMSGRLERRLVHVVTTPMINREAMLERPTAGRGLFPGRDSGAF
jgi:hypothetical protein